MAIRRTIGLRFLQIVLISLLFCVLIVPVAVLALIEHSGVLTGMQSNPVGFSHIVVLLCADLVILVVILLTFGGRHLNRPLKILASKTADFAAGTPVVIRDRYRIRELDDLAQSISGLMDSAARREDELRSLTGSLEAQVLSRTKIYQETIETLRSTREQMLLSEKMATLGSLVTGIAHEINTPMSIGVTAASYLNERTRSILGEWDAQTLSREGLEQFLKDSEESSRIIQMNLDHAGRIINGLKQVAADQQTDERREFELTSYMENIVLSLKHQLRTGRHRIVLDREGLVVVDSYPGAVTQIVTNLVMNSLLHGFADRTGGQIGIRIRDDGADALIVYHDNGRGLSDEEYRRIWEKYFTTRSGRGGTGVGMSIVRDLVSDKLGGRIDITPPEGSGAGFTVRFPKKAGGTE